MLEAYCVLPESFRNERLLERTRYRWSTVTFVAFGFLIVCGGIRWQIEQHQRRQRHQIERAVAEVYKNRQRSRHMVARFERLQSQITEFGHLRADGALVDLLQYWGQETIRPSGLRVESLQFDRANGTFELRLIAAEQVADRYTEQLRQLPYLHNLTREVIREAEPKSVHQIGGSLSTLLAAPSTDSSSVVRGGGPLNSVHGGAPHG